MSIDDAPRGPEEPTDLQFDHVESNRPLATTGSPSVTCVVCKQPVGSEYFAINGKPVCASCREKLMSSVTAPMSVGPLLIGGLFGLGAAIAGAAIYYAVAAIGHVEIGIVAILIGYMVGWSIRKGAGGRGGRRFQILAVVLTYWAVGLAYTPFTFKGLRKGKEDATVTAPDTSHATGQTIGERLGDTTQTLASGDAGTSTSGTSTGPNPVLAIGALLVLPFTLPVLTVFGSLPFGLISGLIIFIGMRQAWAMTGARNFKVSGPYRVGTGPAPAAS